MGRKKTKLLSHGFQGWHNWQLECQILKKMRVFPEHGLRGGKLPADIGKARSVLTSAFNNPAGFVNDSIESQELRLELAQLLVKFPEFLAAAIYCVFCGDETGTKQKQGKSVNSKIREFLLTEDIVSLPDGKLISQVGATDAEIAMAVQLKYGIKDVKVGTVKTERQRLEKLFSTSITEFVDRYLEATKEHDQIRCPKEPEASRRERRAKMLRSCYKQSSFKLPGASMAPD